MAEALTGKPLDAELERALTFGSIEELEGLDELKAIENSGLAYMITKRANALRVQGQTVSWGERGARTLSISPGVISTPLARDEMNGPNKAGYENVIKNSPAQRMGNPTEVADLAEFLMGETGSFITGIDVLQDGGVIAAQKAGRL